MFGRLSQAIENLKLIPGLIKDLHEILQQVQTLRQEIRDQLKVIGDQFISVKAMETHLSGQVDAIRKKLDSLRLPFK